MKPHDETLSDVPGLDGPDYVAFVIDFDDTFDDLDDVEIDQLVDTVLVTDEVAPRRRPLAVAGAILGVAGVIALALWGVRRFHAA